MVGGFFRNYARRGNKVLIWLTLEEWPRQIPLPPVTVLHVTGDGPYRPYWEIMLNGDNSEEHLFGWFNTATAADATVEWYREAMTQHGWSEDSAKSQQMAGQHHLEFQNATAEATAAIDVRSNPSLISVFTVRCAARTPWKAVTPPDAAVLTNSESGEAE